MNKLPKIVAIVGMTGAGKSEAAHFFREKSIPVLRFGDQTDLGLKELGKEINPKNETWYRENLRKELGMAAYAIKIEPRIREAAKTYSFIVLDGLYSWEEYLYLNERFTNFFLLCIYAHPEIRYERLSERKIRPLTRREARERDIHELEITNKGGPIAIADYLIHNEGSLPEFYAELDKLYSSL